MWKTQLNIENETRMQGKGGELKEETITLNKETHLTTNAELNSKMTMLTF